MCPLTTGKSGKLDGWELYCGSGWLNKQGEISSFKTVTGQSYSDCQTECEKLESCVGFTFVTKDNKTCDLKTVNDAATLNDDFGVPLVSGRLIQSNDVQDFDLESFWNKTQLPTFAGMYNSIAP